MEGPPWHLEAGKGYPEKGHRWDGVCVLAKGKSLGLEVSFEPAMAMPLGVVIFLGGIVDMSPSLFLAGTST